jgi:hypothetical protein
LITSSCSFIALFKLFNKINKVPEFTQSLSVTPVEPRGQARHISWPASPLGHLVSPIGCANSETQWHDIPTVPEFIQSQSRGFLRSG